MTTAVRSSGMPSRWQAAWMMRRLAWWGTSREMSSGPMPGVGHGPLGRLDHDPDGPAEDLLAVHEEGAAVLALEEVAQRAVGVQVPAEQAARALRPARSPRRRRRRRR